MPPYNPYYNNPQAYGATGLEHYGIRPVDVTAPQAMATMGHTVLPMAATGMALATGMDPLTLGYGAFKNVATPGVGTGLSGFKGMAGRVLGGKVGLGRLAAGAGAAMLPMAAGMAVSSAAEYGVNQMVQGAGVQAGMRSALGSSNFGFRGGQMRGMNMDEVTQTFRQVYSMAQDLDRGVQEITGTITSMRNLNLTQTVRNVREFRAKFKEASQALDQIASEYGVTMKEATAFFKGAKSAGFSTMGDQLSSLQATRRAEWATGLNRAQVQGAMRGGTQLARAVGATGWRGAMGMARGLETTGAALQSGVISEQMLEEATGQTGAGAITGFSQLAQRSMARRMSTKFGRYFLAAAAGDDMRRLDPDKMARMFSGAYSMEDIQKMGRKATYGKGREGMADRFLMYEEEMRGQMMQAGPTALAGMMRAELGDRIYDTEDYRVNKDVRRKYGLNKRQASTMLRMARNLDEIMGEQFRQEEQRLQLQQSGYSSQGQLAKLKSSVSRWIDKNVDSPLQQLGAAVSRKLTETGERIGAYVMGETYEAPGTGSKRARVQQTAGSRAYIRGVITGEYDMPQMGGGGGGGLGLNMFTGAGQASLLSGESPYAIAAGRGFKAAGFDSYGEMVGSSEGLRGAWRKFAQSKQAAGLFGSDEFMGATGTARARMIASAIRQHGGGLGKFLGEGGNTPQDLARVTHLAGRYARSGSLLRPKTAMGMGLGVTRELTDSRMDKIRRNYMLTIGQASKKDVDVAMPKLDLGESWWTDTAGSAVNIGEFVSGEQDFTSGNIYEAGKDVLSLTTGHSLLGRYAPGAMRDMGISGAISKVSGWFGAEKKAKKKQQRVGAFKELYQSKYAKLLMKASNGSESAMRQLQTLAGQEKIHGLSSGASDILRKTVKGLKEDPEAAKKAIQGAAPLIYQKQMQDYKTRIQSRSSRIEQSIVGEQAYLQKTGMDFDFGIEDPRERFQALEEYFGDYMGKSAEERARISDIYKGAGFAGAEFTAPMQYLSGVEKSLGGIKKGKEATGKKGRRLLSQIMGRSVTKEVWGGLKEGMSVSDIQEKLGIDEELAGRVQTAMESGGLGTEEGRALAKRVAAIKAAGTYTGGLRKEMDILDSIVETGKEGFGTATGMQKELTRQTVILMQIARKSGVTAEALKKIGYRGSVGGDRGGDSK